MVSLRATCFPVSALISRCTLPWNFHEDRERIQSTKRAPSELDFIHRTSFLCPFPLPVLPPDGIIYLTSFRPSNRSTGSDATWKRRHTIQLAKRIAERMVRVSRKKSLRCRVFLVRYVERNPEINLAEKTYKTHGLMKPFPFKASNVCTLSRCSVIRASLCKPCFTAHVKSCPFCEHDPREPSCFHIVELFVINILREANWNQNFSPCSALYS